RPCHRLRLARVGDGVREQALRRVVDADAVAALLVLDQVEPAAVAREAVDGPVAVEVHLPDEVGLNEVDDVDVGISPRPGERGIAAGRGDSVHVRLPRADAEGSAARAGLRVAAEDPRALDTLTVVTKRRPSAERTPS